VELEASLGKFKAQGLGVATFSYDSPDVLRHFSERMGGFSYPVLADPESEVIRAFGLFNTNVPEDSPAYGMAFPGTFVVDEKGIVRSKYFQDSHRQRFTADTILVKEFGVVGNGQLEVTTNHLTLSAFPSQDLVRRGNRITLVLDIELPPKMHVYAPGVEGYHPVAFALDDRPYVKFHETVFPEPEILHLEAIKETVPVYENHVRILQDVTISPRLPGWDSAETADSKVVLPATFSYQACDDRICYAPAKVPLTFTLNVVAHDVERVPENLRRETKKTEP
jgi:hypothetical protein